MKYNYFIDNQEVDFETFQRKLYLDYGTRLENQFNDELNQRPFTFEGKDYKYSDAWKLLDDEGYWLAFKGYKIRSMVRIILDMQKHEKTHIGIHKFQVSKGGF